MPLQNAPLFLRFVASTVDGFALLILAAGCAVGLIAVPLRYGSVDGGYVALFIALLLGAAALWYALFRDGDEHGQGIGKRLCGIQLVDADSGRPPGWTRAAARNLIQWLFSLTVILGLIDLLLCLADERQRRLVDRIVGTRVVLRIGEQSQPGHVHLQSPAPVPQPLPVVTRPVRPDPVTIPITAAYLEGLVGPIAGTVLRLPVQLGGQVDCVLGRGEPAAGVSLLDLRSPMVSRQQARIMRHEGLWYVQHLSTTNPTQINGQDVGPPGTLAHLVSGSELTMGDVKLRFHAGA